MNYQAVERFSSKRNEVLLATPCLEPNKLVVVKNFGGNKEAYKTEIKVITALKSRGITTPEILKSSLGEIVYEYIDGEIVLNYIDKLEQDSTNTSLYNVFDKLCLWLASCYKALEIEFGKEMILSDIHLRNFIFKNEIYGLDFECVKEGKVEEDIARLAVFTATYFPECTDAKYNLAGFICKKSLEYMNLDYELILKEMEKHLDIIGKRRKTEYSCLVVHNIIENIENANNLNLKAERI